MTQLTALKELAEKVEAGEGFGSVDNAAALAFPPESAGGPCTFHMVSKAHQGSIDAAKATHEAVLGVAGYKIDGDIVSSTYRCRVEVGIRYFVEESTSPTRAWLLAIIRAKIAELESEA